MGFVDDIEQSLREFSEIFANVESCEVKIGKHKICGRKFTEFSHQKQIEIKRKLGEIIDFHVETRQLSDEHKICFIFLLAFLFSTNSFEYFRFVLDFLDIFSPYMKIFFSMQKSFVVALLLSIQDVSF